MLSFQEHTVYEVLLRVVYQQITTYRNEHVCIPFSASMINDRTADAMLHAGQHILGNAVSGQIWRCRF